MDILQYLIALLTTRKQIGIEGLGTLYKKKTPGRYDAETHSFLPPSYALEFTSEILESTNLVEYIQSKRGISQDAAKYFISQFVAEVQNGLQQGEYQLENLGSFTKTNDQLIFSPSQDLNTGFDFFALPSVTAELPQVEAPAQPVEESDEEEVQEEISDVSTENLDQPEIEQVQVPEFEQELAKITGESELIYSNEENEVEETLSEETFEEHIAQEELVEVEEQTNSTDNNEATQEEVFEEITEVNTTAPTTELEAASKEEIIEVDEQTNSTENNEATQEEVFEEITEVNTSAPATEPEAASKEEIIEVDEQTNSTGNNEATQEEVFEEITEVDTTVSTTELETTDKEENDTWDFDGENVVSEHDFHLEEPTDADSENKEEAASYTSNEEKDFKLTSTVHEWDFDSVRSKTGKEDTDLIGEFDNVEVEEPAENEKQQMPLYQKLIIGLVILAAAIAVAYFVKPQLFENFSKNDVDPDQKIAVPIERDNLKTQQDSLDFADSIMQNAEKVGLDVQPAKDTLKVTTAKSEVKPTKTYDIIITSFATEAKAQEYISRMKKKGFDPKISSMEGLRKNISIATYNNIDSAQKYVIKFRKQFRDPEIYIKPIKNN